MNAQVDVPSAGSSSNGISVRRNSSQAATSPADSQQICWIEVKQYPYQPDHQVELLHLQAEADALLLQLQALSQKRLAASSSEGVR